MLNLFKVRIKYFMQNNTKINTQIRPPFPRPLHPPSGGCLLLSHTFKLSASAHRKHQYLLLLQGLLITRTAFRQTIRDKGDL